MKKNLYCTPIWQFNANQKIIKSAPDIDRLAEKYSKEQQNVNGEKIVSTHNGSRIDNANKIVTLKSIHEFIQDCLALAMNDLGVQQSEFKKFSFTSWLNILKDGGFNSVHHHGQNFLSGVYYLKTPDGSGKLHLRDPRPGAYFSGLKVQGFGTDTIVTPGEGGLIIFPSFLEHWVEPCTSKQESRASIAFNLGIL